MQTLSKSDSVVKSSASGDLGRVIDWLRHFAERTSCGENARRALRLAELLDETVSPLISALEHRIDNPKPHALEPASHKRSPDSPESSVSDVTDVCPFLPFTELESPQSRALDQNSEAGPEHDRAGMCGRIENTVSQRYDVRSDLPGTSSNRRRANNGPEILQSAESANRNRSVLGDELSFPGNEHRLFAIHAAPRSETVVSKNGRI